MHAWSSDSFCLHSKTVTVPDMSTAKLDSAAGSIVLIYQRCMKDACLNDVARNDYSKGHVRENRCLPRWTHAQYEPS